MPLYLLFDKGEKLPDLGWRIGPVVEHGIQGDGGKVVLLQKLYHEALP